MNRTRPLLARITALLLCALLSCPVLAPAVFAETTSATDAGAYDASHPENLSAAHLSGQACVVMDEATGDVLFDKNAYDRMYPASTTKIMTLLIALEQGPSLDTVVTIPKEASNVPSDSSKVPVTPGEEMTFADLLYGFMMRSGNDGANAIAVIVSGSISDFVDQMNARATSLGCKDTHFANPHGYHDASHYTTAYDLALIAREGMKNSTFRAIVSCKEYTMAATSVREKYKISTTNPMLVETSQYYYSKICGIKTGYTDAAGRCFVGAAKSGGATLISVTLKTTSAGRWTDTKKLLEYGFTKYKTYSFEDLYGAQPVKEAIENAAEDDEQNGFLEMMVVPGSSLYGYSVNALPDHFDEVAEEFASRLSVAYTRDLTAPVTTGDIMGSLSLETDDGTLTGLLIADRNVAAQPENITFSDVFPAFKGVDMTPFWVFLYAMGAVVVIVAFAYVRVHVRRNRRRKEMLKRRRKAYERYRAMNR